MQQLLPLFPPLLLIYCMCLEQALAICRVFYPACLSCLTICIKRIKCKQMNCPMYNDRFPPLPGDCRCYTSLSGTRCVLSVFHSPQSKWKEIFPFTAFYSKPLPGYQVLEKKEAGDLICPTIIKSLFLCTSCTRLIPSLGNLLRAKSWKLIMRSLRVDNNLVGHK